MLLCGKAIIESNSSKQHNGNPVMGSSVVGYAFHLPFAFGGYLCFAHNIRHWPGAYVTVRSKLACCAGSGTEVGMWQSAERSS